MVLSCAPCLLQPFVSEEDSLVLHFICVACVARVPRATRVSVGMAMSGLGALMIAMREALSALVDLDTTLGTLTGDPWAREVRGTLQRRWAVLDELAAELRDYVEMQNTTLANAISTGTPALVGGLVTLDARDTAARVAEHIARATPAPQPRPSSVGPNKIPGGGTAAARDPARWADELVDTPRAASSQAPPVLAAAVATHLLPQPGARVQAPYKAPLGLVTPPTSAPQLGTPIPTQAIPTPRVAGLARLPSPTPLIPAAPQTPIVWLAPVAQSRSGQAWQRAGTGGGTGTPAAPWGTRSRTALPRDGVAHYWEHGRPAGWKIVMGDLPSNVTPGHVRTLALRDTLWNMRESV